jgi:hypothetical protein
VLERSVDYGCQPERIARAVVFVLPSTSRRASKYWNEEHWRALATFSYRIAVTHLRGDPDAWAQDPLITQNLAGCSFGFLTLETMWATMLDELKTTPASSEIGRLAQLLKAAGLTERRSISVPQGPVPGSEAALEDELVRRSMS